MSEERRRASDDLHTDVKEISKSVTEISTMLAINFHPETGHVTKRLTSLESKVSSHDTDIKRAKWTIGLSTPFVLAGIAWLKSKVMGSN